ncbi:MAG: thiosulfate oxidation carrier complex protein SoxZ [Burkholderiaceae bacterium]
MTTPIPSRLSFAGKVSAGNTIEVRWIAGHAMESGFRLNDAGQPIPRNIINQVRVSLNDKLILEAKTGTGLSAHPYLAFSLLVPPQGGTVSVQWVDDLGQRGQVQQQLRLIP